MSPPPCTATTTTATGGGAAAATNPSHIPHDIIRAQILPRLDGPALATTSCASKELLSLSSDEALWTHLCHSTWPSTLTPRVKQIVSGFFPHGPRSFFSHALPLHVEGSTSAPYIGCLSELISAVDIFYKEDAILSKAVETETASLWFMCSPFRIDMLDPKDTCPTPIPPSPCTAEEEACREMKLSWILIDPAGGRAVNLSSNWPVAVERHWLSGDVHARFGVVVGGGRVLVQCSVVVTRVGGEGGMRVREVSLQMEDLDGVVLNGKDCLGILQGMLEGNKGISHGIRVGIREGGKCSYEMFLKMKEERRERKLRAEGTLDMFCVAFGVLSFASLGLFYLFR